MALYDSKILAWLLKLLVVLLDSVGLSGRMNIWNWLKELVKHTICNNKFMYRGSWYLAKKGIHTEGVLSPRLADITMKYEDDVNANHQGFQGIMRFIGDLGGRWVLLSPFTNEYNGSMVVLNLIVYV